MFGVDKIKYIEPVDLVNIVNIIRGFDYEYEEEVPNYDEERNGIDNYFSLVDRSKQRYYPDLFSKASFLFININSHYFFNGNKRLSVISTVYFLEKNKYSPVELSKEDYSQILKNLFGDVSLVDWKNFEAIDFALYNLAIIVARQNEESTQKISPDELKIKVKNFFEKTFQIKQNNSS